MKRSIHRLLFGLLAVNAVGWPGVIYASFSLPVRPLSQPQTQPPAPPPPEIQTVVVRFHTKDEDKDSTTKVEITLVKPNATVAAASIDNKAFRPNSPSEPIGLQIRTKTKKDEIRNCFVTVKVIITGSDDPWEFALDIEVNFTDGSKIDGRTPAVSLDKRVSTITFPLPN